MKDKYITAFLIFVLLVLYTTLALIILYPRCKRDTDDHVFAGREGNTCYYIDTSTFGHHEIYTEPAQ